MNSYDVKMVNVHTKPQTSDGKDLVLMHQLKISRKVGRTDCSALTSSAL